MRTMLPLLLTASCICGCTTMRAVPPSDLQSTVAELQPGDRIALRVADSDSWEENLTVVGVSDTTIQTQDRSGARDTLTKEAISDMRIRQIAPGKIIALVFGILSSGIPGLSL
jgi:hypothetical protein